LLDPQSSPAGGLGAGEPFRHEAFRTPGVAAGRLRAPKSPPPPPAETSTPDRPGPDAQWVAGYWAWDASRGDFVWVRGIWRVPPRGRFWVNGRWVRDANGWSRIPGFWSDRHVATGAWANAPDGISGGPPADAPREDPGPAPGPDFFLVPGHYRPEADRTVWVRGFWARSQPGWDWVPARWVRRADGWEYREGYWAREPVTTTIQRHEVARPAAEEGRADLPPAIVDSEPAGLPPGSTSTAEADRLPTARDPIAGAENAAATAANAVAPTVAVVPPYVVRYPPLVPPFVAPPGYYLRPRLPARAFVPYDSVPPFVRRILDRVLP
jgi:hypothetical protein